MNRYFYKETRSRPGVGARGDILVHNKHTFTHSPWIDPAIWTQQRYDSYVRARDAFCKQYNVQTSNYSDLCAVVQSRLDAEHKAKCNEKSKLAMSRLRKRRRDGSSSSSGDDDVVVAPKRQPKKKQQRKQEVEKEEEEGEEEEVLDSGFVVPAAPAASSASSLPSMVDDATIRSLLRFEGDAGAGGGAGGGSGVFSDSAAAAWGSSFGIAQDWSWESQMLGLPQVAAGTCICASEREDIVALTNGCGDENCLSRH